MKNLSFSPTLKLLVVLIGFLSVSCNKDDERIPDPTPLSNTDYDNIKYNIKNGFVQDGGAMDIFLDDEAVEKTHYNYNFLLTDGTPVFEGEEVVSMDDGKIIITAVLLSPGTSGFKTGEFEFIDWTDLDDVDDLSEEELKELYKDKFFSPLAFIITDSDEDQNWEEETGQLVTGGTFKVTGTAPNFTTEYDLTLENNKTAKGKFSGVFKTAQN